MFVESARHIPTALKAFRPRNLAVELITGILAGFLTVTYSVSNLAIIFAGPLAPHLPEGIGIAIFSSVVLGLLITLSSGLKTVICIPQDKPAAIFAAVSGALASAALLTRPEAMLPTVLASIAVLTLGTGLFFFFCGWFRVGGFIRYIPYPVVGGFIAGTGWLIFRSAFTVLTGARLEFHTLAAMTQSDLLPRWLPSLVVGACMLLATHRWRHSLLMPGMLLAAIILFYGITTGMGVSVADLLSGGWLLGPFPAGSLWHPLQLSTLQHTDWALLAGETGGMLTVMLVSAISILFTVTSLELHTDGNVDIDKELRAAGIGNIACSLGGGMVGYHALSLSSLNYAMGSRTRFAGLIAIGICIIALVAGAAPLSYFPKPVLGGLLFFLAMTFLWEWIVEARAQLPRLEYGLMITILFCIAGFGFITGVGVGVVIASILFVVQYSRVNVVKYALSGAHHRSHVERTESQLKILRERGDQLLILRLRSFLFFGTANSLLQQVTDRLQDAKKSRITMILLDFSLVSGIDSSAVLSFTKIKKLARRNGIQLVFANLGDRIQRELTQGGCLEDSDAVCRVFADRDRGLEWCEENILAGAHADGAMPATLREQLAAAFPEPGAIDTFLAVLERRELPTGIRLFRQGDAADGLYFIESGELTVQLEGGNGATERVSTLKAGTVVGEIGIYTGTPRTATVIATQTAVLYRLSPEAFHRLGTTHPAVESRLHQFVVRLLAERLAQTVLERRVLLGE